MLIIFFLALIVSASCLDSRIVGGKSTTIYQHPYQVSIHYNGKHDCGGSIIHKEWILTAAHCVCNRSLSLFKVRVGSTYHDEGGTLISEIAGIISHENYNALPNDYDVGLIKLFTPLTLGANVKILVLALQSSTIETGSQAIVTGWGKISASGPISKELRNLIVPVIDQEECQQIFDPYKGVVTSNMLCAGYTTGEKDTCEGDSGGALVYNGVQIGIVSWGAQCASVGFPGVYTRVSAIRQWITNYTYV